MKIRQGFVSNSSSSSFLIYGAVINLDDVEAYKALTEEQLDEGSWQFMEDYLGESGLGWHDPYDDRESIFVGRSWHAIGDDETGRQFKDSVEDEMNRLFPECNLYFDSLAEAWRDG